MNHQCFSLTLIPKAMTRAFLHTPSNANGNKEITYGSILLPGYATNPQHLANSDDLFDQKQRDILHKRAKPEIMIPAKHFCYLESSEILIRPSIHPTPDKTTVQLIHSPPACSPSGKVPSSRGKRVFRNPP